MPPHTQPTQLKILRGNPGKRPLNLDEPQGEPVLPEAPEHLDKWGKAEWERVTPLLYSCGLLTTLDISAVEAYCTCYSRWRQAEEKIAKTGLLIKGGNGQPAQSPYVIIANQAMAQMLKYLAEFGMTPSSRTKVQVNRRRADSDFDEF